MNILHYISYRQQCIWPCCLLVILLSACQRQHRPPVRAFYYWKTVYNLSSSESAAIQQLHCKRTYVRCFDVDWNEAQQKSLPVGIVRLPAQLDTAMEFVPVFFITQPVLAHLTENNTDSLAENINKLLVSLCAQSGWKPKEIQVDCDWTAGTKGIYFSLLKKLKVQSAFRHKEVSCTIRLHQVKYFLKSGIPPVDKGLLMCYNLGDLRKYGKQNSILDVDLAEDYLQHLSGYPLKLDVALPLFRWSVLFRNSRFSGILRGVDADELQKNTGFVRLSENFYRCNKEQKWHDYYFQVNDEVRVEMVAYKDILKMSKYLASNLKHAPANVCLFHLDSATISKYETQELENIYAAFN